MSTLAQLGRVCRRAPAARLAKVVDAFNAALPIAEATTPFRESMFLAQIAHETDEFRYAEEVWGPTPAQDRYDVRPDLGNTPERDGDGETYKGRGWLQLTGHANYAKAGVALGLPLVEHPELAAMPENAAKIAAWFWITHGCNAPSDRGDVKAVTKIINGGFNGLAQRTAYYARAVEAFGLALPLPVA